MTDEMDFEYTLNHADEDLQRVQAERDEEARLISLAHDELDLILAQQARDAEEENASRQVPRPPEVIPTNIAEPQHAGFRPPEAETTDLPEPESTHTKLPPKILGLRLKGEELKQLLAKKKQALLNENTLRGQGIESGSIHNGKPRETHAPLSLRPLSEHLGTPTTRVGLAAHSQHQLLPTHIAPVSFSIFEAPRNSNQAPRSMINPGGVQPLLRSNYMEWPNGQPVAGSNRAKAPLHAPLGPKAMYSSPSEPIMAKPVQSMALMATVEPPAFGVSGSGTAGAYSGAASMQQKPFGWPSNATNSFKEHSTSFRNNGGFFPPQ